MRPVPEQAAHEPGDGGGVLCCPDKFRDSLTAPQAALALATGVRSAGLPAIEHPLADGGEGTLAAVAAATGAAVHRVEVTGPLGACVHAQVAMLPDGDAVVELAQAAGIGTLRSGPDVMRASTAGVGELLIEALRLGARRVIVGLGGSATVDGGLGALRAIGARLYDTDGVPLVGCGGDLVRLATIDTAELDWRLRGRLVLAADVGSPLTGPDGAAREFAPQKGAGPAQVEALEHGLGRLADVLGNGIARQPGSGAAGGFAVPFVSLLGAQLRSGAALVQQLTGFHRALTGTAACITGEGRVDAQSVAGKVVAKVVDEARRENVPAFVVGGEVAPGSSALYDSRAAAILPIGRRPQSLPEALSSAPADLSWMGASIARLLQALAPRGAILDTLGDERRLQPA